MQNSLFEKRNSEEQKKSDRLIKTVDNINKRYGSRTVDWAVCGIRKGSIMRRELLGNFSTTNIHQIPIVKT